MASQRFFSRLNPRNTTMSRGVTVHEPACEEQHVVDGTETPPAAKDEKDVTSSDRIDSTGSDSDLENMPSSEAEAGVKKVEAVTLTWTLRELILAYAFVFLVFFVVSMEQQIHFNLTVYVTSSFYLLPLTSTTSVISGVVGGVIKLPTAKFIDLIGRAEGFAIMVVLATVGVIMMAATQSVEMYAAAQVFYWVGFNGMAYVLDVFLADTSSLKNRALVFSFSTTPYIATTFIGPAAAESFINTSTWQWGYGTFAIITPVIALPILTVLWINQRKAYKLGLLKKREKSGRTFFQSVSYWFWEFDVIGLLLISIGFVLLLLPLALGPYQRERYGTDWIIAMFVLGPIFLIAFGLYEKYHPHKPFIPFDLLRNPSVFGACATISFFFISFYCWDSSFLNYLQAVRRLSVKNAGYVFNIYSIGSCFFGPFVALAIRSSGRFKWIALYFALPLELLGNGLLIHFRQPDHNLGYLIMCQIFIAFAGGAIVICTEMAVMAAAPHQNVAGMLALIGLFSSVGGAIGQAISGAIYTNTFPGALDRALGPDRNQTLSDALYGSLITQLTYPWDSPERTATVEAYAYTQKYLTIAGTCFLIPCFFFTAIWKNFRVDELRQVKGRTV